MLANVVPHTFLVAKRRTVPFFPIACRRLASKPVCRQPPMWCLTATFDAEVGRRNHDYEAVVLQLSEPSTDLIAMRAQLLRGNPGREIDRPLLIGVVTRFKRGIERPCAMRQSVPCGVADHMFVERHERWQPLALIAHHAEPLVARSLSAACLENRADRYPIDSALRDLKLDQRDATRPISFNDQDVIDDLGEVLGDVVETLLAHACPAIVLAVGVGAGSVQAASSRAAIRPLIQSEISDSIQASRFGPTGLAWETGRL